MIHLTKLDTKNCWDTYRKACLIFMKCSASGHLVMLVSHSVLFFWGYKIYQIYVCLWFLLAFSTCACIIRCRGRAWKNFFNLAMKSFSRPAWRWSSLNACVTRCWGLDVGGLHKKNILQNMLEKNIFINDITYIKSYMGFWVSYLLFI